MSRHRVFWGSHGCDLEQGHTEPCVCIHNPEDMYPPDPSDRIEWATIPDGVDVFGSDAETAVYPHENV